jgi:uroporphyrinogen-III synthase
MADRPAEPLPLQGWRVLVTRAAEHSDSLSEQLRSLGAEPIAYPTIAFAPPEDEQPIKSALQRLIHGEYEWLVLTSVTGVRFVADYLKDLLDSGTTCHLACNIAVVGSATATACTELLGTRPSLVPEKFEAEALAEALGSMEGEHVLLAQANLARPVLYEHLQQAGAQVDAVVAYRTVNASGGAIDMPALLAQGGVDAITFTSGSTVRAFVQRIGAEALPHARQAVIACIGPVTAQAAEEASLPPDVVAETSTVEGLVAALVAWRQEQTAAG